MSFFYHLFSYSQLPCRVVTILPEVIRFVEQQLELIVYHGDTKTVLSKSSDLITQAKDC